MISDTGIWLRRARRSSASITSSACPRVKQPVSASRTLFSFTSRNSCAFLIDTASSVAAASMIRRRSDASMPPSGRIPSTPIGVPPAISGNPIARSVSCPASCRDR